MTEGLLTSVFSKRSLADLQRSSIVTDLLKSASISSNLSSEAVASSHTSFTSMGSCAAAAEVVAPSAAPLLISFAPYTSLLIPTLTLGYCWKAHELLFPIV
jgi:hypothetical protein